MAAKITQPLVSIKAELSLKDEAPVAIPLSALSDIATRASEILQDVREHMLAPHPRKNPPVYSGAQVAALCGIDRARLNYLVSRGELPSGTVEGPRKSRHFTLKETRECI